MKLALFLALVAFGMWRGWHEQWAEGAYWLVLALILHPMWGDDKQ